MTYKDDIERLNKRQAEAYAAAEELLSTASKEDRDFSGEEEAKWERTHKEIVRIEEMKACARDLKTSLTETAEKREEIAAITGQSVAQVADVQRVETFEDQIRAMVNGRREAVILRRPTEKRVIETVNETGPIPTTTWSDTHVYLDQGSTLRRAGATVVQLGSYEPVKFNRITAESTAALVAEGAAASASDPTLSSITFNPYKYMFLTYISREFMLSETANAMAALNKQALQALAIAEDTDFITGSGSSRPNGIDNATTGKTFASATVVTANELIDLFYSVADPHRNHPTCGWIFNDTTASEVRQLLSPVTTSGGQNYIWTQGIADQPSTLLGKPVFLDSNVGDTATGVNSFVFGNMSSYYIVDREGIRIETSADAGFTSDTIAVRYIRSTDGDLLDAEGIRTGTQN